MVFSSCDGYKLFKIWRKNRTGKFFNCKTYIDLRLKKRKKRILVVQEDRVDVLSGVDQCNSGRKLRCTLSNLSAVFECAQKQIRE